MAMICIISIKYVIANFCNLFYYLQLTYSDAQTRTDRWIILLLLEIAVEF